MVGIICFWDRYATPYLDKYERMLQHSNEFYEVVFWNREAKYSGKAYRKIGHEIQVDYPCLNGSRKLLSFLGWARRIRKVINERGYSHLIVLSTVPAVLLFDVLVKQYKNKYIFDIRDYTFEKFVLFKKLVMALIAGSSLTAISSKGYMKWLDESPKIMVNHNITISYNNGFTAPDFTSTRPVRFSFVGNVRLDTQTRAMLLSLGHSTKIEQHYYGRVLDVCDIRSLIDEYQLVNVKLHGPFDVSEKESIYADTDLINTVYANAEKEEDIPLGDSTPLPNRLYDALVFYRPLVSSRGTFLAELSERYHLGVSVNGFDKNIEDEILEYVHSFNREEFMSGCDTLREIVTEEEQRFKEKVLGIIKDWKE